MTARKPIWPDDEPGKGEGGRWPPLARVALWLTLSLSLWVVLAGVVVVCMALASLPP